MVTSQVEVELLSDPEAPEILHRALERLVVVSARVDGIVVSSAYAGIEALLEGIWE